MHLTAGASSPLTSQVDINMRHEFSRITEAGEQLEPISGPGLVGLYNLGNSCYLASVMQVRGQGCMQEADSQRVAVLQLCWPPLASCRLRRCCYSTAWNQAHRQRSGCRRSVSIAKHDVLAWYQLGFLGFLLGGSHSVRTHWN